MQLTEEEINSFQEVINIGVGEAAGVLNEMLNAHITLAIPYIKELHPSHATGTLINQLGTGQLSSVELEFSGSVKGNAELVFPTDSASKLVQLIADEEMESDDPDWDSMKIGALTEIGNIVISGVMGSISNLLSQKLDYLLPNYIEGEIETLLKRHIKKPEATLLLAQTKFIIEETQIRGDIILMFQVESVPILLSSLNELVD